MPGGAERVALFLEGRGIRVETRVFDESTKSSALAAQALGCSVAEIAKSVVFLGSSGCYVVVISGDRRVDPAKLSRASGEPVSVARPDQVRERTGYAIGGVPPFPHGPGVTVYCDASVARFQSVWAAAGTPNAVFRVATADLFRTAGSQPADLSQ